MVYIANNPTQDQVFVENCGMKARGHERSHERLTAIDQRSPGSIDGLNSFASGFVTFFNLPAKG